MPSARCSLTLTEMLTLTAMLSHPSLYLFSGNAHICSDYKFHTPHSFHALHYFSEQLLCVKEWAWPSRLPLFQLQMQEVHILDEHGLRVKAEVSWSLFLMENC